jgi:hypothetical protein
MAKITVYGSVWTSDPGVVNRSIYEGTIDVADVKPDRDLTNIVDDQWWRADVGYKFAALYFKELRADGAVFTYGTNEVIAPFGKTTFIAEVGLSYAYGGLSVKVIQ